VNPHDEFDIDALHRAVLREQKEPWEGREPVPPWMIAGFVALVGWGGWYLGRWDARFDYDVTEGHWSTTAAAPSAATQGTAEGSGPDLAAVGAQVYASRCAACHQPTGQGMKNVAPPLDGSEWVQGDVDRLVKVVLHGLSGPIEVKGEAWNGAMPPWGPSLSDEEIAGVLTHVRSSWSNAAGPVDPAKVAEIRGSVERSTPWTASEL